MLSTTQQIPTLLTLTTHHLTETRTRKLDFSQLSLLPSNLKDILRGILLKRGIRGEELKHLLHLDVKELDLSDCRKNEQLLCVVKSCKYLRKLHINCVKDEDETTRDEEESRNMSRYLSEIITDNKFLRSLFLRNLSLVVTDPVLSCLPPHLQELDLGGCQQITDVGVSSVVTRCPILSSLSLSATNITDNSLQVKN